MAPVAASFIMGPAAPAAQLMPMRMREMPMTEMMEPVTTGGKSGRSQLMTGAARMPKMPAAMTAPKMPVMPMVGSRAMTTMGLTAAKVTPIITGRRMPKRQMPRAWMRVTTPQAKRSALIRRASWSLGSLRAPPTISGTATAPAYITSTCWIPSRESLPRGSISSTGWTPCVVLISSPVVQPLRACMGVDWEWNEAGFLDSRIEDLTVNKKISMG